MSILGLLLSLLLALIAVAIVAHPLLGAARSRQDAGSDDDAQRERVGNYYERVLTNIRDLDEDLATGKISEADHGREREVWVARGITLLRLQDQLDAQQSAAPPDSEAIDRAIEVAVAAYREGKLPALDEGIQ